MSIPLARPEILLAEEAGARLVLRRAYTSWPEPDRSRLVYANVPRVQAFYIQGKAFWEAAKEISVLSVRYLLCYTAIHNWGKVRILLADPYYPRKRSDQSHGLSLRATRRGRGDLDGEVFIEPQGLFSLLLIGDERSALVGKRVPIRILLQNAFARLALRAGKEAEEHPNFTMFRGENPKVQADEAEEAGSILQGLREDLLHFLATFVLANFARYEADRFFRLLDGSYDLFPFAVETYAEFCVSCLPSIVFFREISGGLLPNKLPAEVFYERT